MTNVLVDTDVFVDHLRGAATFRPRQDRIWYSSVTRCELFAGDRHQEEASRRLLDPYREVPVERAVAERAGRLRRDHRLEFADALIAATALQHRLVLVSRNQRHFEGVRGLRLRTPG